MQRVWLQSALTAAGMIVFLAAGYHVHRAVTAPPDGVTVIGQARAVEGDVLEIKGMRVKVAGISAPRM